MYGCPLHRPLFFCALKRLYATLGIHEVSKGRLHLNSADWKDVLPTDAQFFKKSGLFLLHSSFCAFRCNTPKDQILILGSKQLR